MGIHFNETNMIRIIKVQYSGIPRRATVSFVLNPIRENERSGFWYIAIRLGYISRGCSKVWSVAVCCPSCLQRLDHQFPIFRRWLIERTIGKWEGNYQSLKSKMNQKFHMPIFTKIFKSNHIYAQTLKLISSLTVTLFYLC